MRALAYSLAAAVIAVPVIRFFRRKP